MKKAATIILIAAALVGVGMIISFYGASLITQGVAVTEGQVSRMQSIELIRELDPSVADIGIFVVQMQTQPSSTLTARVFDSSGSQIDSASVTERSVEKQFRISSKGEYRLVLESTDSEAMQAILGLSHMPDKSIVALNVFGQAAILCGFVGVAIAVIYAVKNRRRAS